MPQSLFQQWIHIIFSTKNRYPFLKELTARQQMHKHIETICNNHQCQTIIVGGTEDHVHLLTNLNKNITLSALIEKIKTSSSKWIKSFQGNMLDQFYWQRGYGAFSVSQSNLESVRLYINNQDKHHQKQNFQEELKKFLEQHRLPYKEEYLWD